MTKFGSSSEIPARFIERNVSIRGKVRSVTERGLEVEHIPIHVPLLSPLLAKSTGTDSSLLPPPPSYKNPPVIKPTPEDPIKTAFHLPAWHNQKLIHSSNPSESDRLCAEWCLVFRSIFF